MSAETYLELNSNYKCRCTSWIKIHHSNFIQNPLSTKLMTLFWLFRIDHLTWVMTDSNNLLVLCSFTLTSLFAGQNFLSLFFHVVLSPLLSSSPFPFSFPFLFLFCEGTAGGAVQEHDFSWKLMVLSYPLIKQILTQYISPVIQDGQYDMVQHKGWATVACRNRKLLQDSKARRGCETWLALQIAYLSFGFNGATTTADN